MCQRRNTSGYCFLGCFWKPIFKAIGSFLKQAWGSIVQLAATAICVANPICAPFAALVAGAASAVVTGITSGNLGLALRAGITAFFTAAAFDAVGTATLGNGHPMPEFMSPAHIANMAGHALVGCASAVMGGGKCGPGALSAAAGSFAGPILKDLGFQRNLIAHAVVGGLASVAAGGKFANGAVTAAFGYLFNQMAGEFRRMAENAPAYAAQQAADQAVSDAMSDPDQPRSGETRQYGGDLICNYDGSVCRNAANINSTWGAEVLGGAAIAGAGFGGNELATRLTLSELLQSWGIAWWLMTGQPGTAPPGRQMPGPNTSPPITGPAKPVGPKPKLD